MIYMFAFMIFGSAFTLCVKWVQNRGREDMVTIGMINYIVAAFAILPDFLHDDSLAVDPNAVACGATMGLAYFIAFFFVTYTVREVGASSSTVVGVLSIVVPISSGIVIWNEMPSSIQVVGVILALFSLILISSSRLKNKSSRREAPEALIQPAVGVGGEAVSGTLPADSEEGSGRWKVILILAIFFLLCGISRLAQEALKHVSDSEQRPTFLLAAFTVASIPSAVVLIWRRKRILPMEIVLGVALGLTNLLQSHFILKALQFFEAFVVFPVTSAGGLLFTTLIATQLLNERLTRRAYFGIALATVALVLLN